MFPARALIFILAAAVSTEHKRRLQPRISRELDVSISIADHPASSKINLKLFCGTIDQSSLRLATVAINPVRRLTHGWMMRAVVNCIELRILQLSFELLMNLNDHVFRKITACNPGLIRNQNRQPTIVVQN